MRKQSTEQFVAKAKKTHGDYYDYSQAKYISANDKVTIICSEHGAFQQRASHHLSGSGCRFCANKQRGDNLKHTHDDFVKKARKVHGQKYDYSKAKYVNSHTNLDIICNVHGLFSQTASTHLSGAGCPACSGVARLDTEKLIQRAKEVHGKKYDYSHADYKNNKTKIKIICPEHGMFEQTPANHLQGMGCLLCGYKNAGQYHKKNTESFIAEARKIHGNKYDYSDVEYKGAREKITIICPKHGRFEQIAHVHLRGEDGKGCLQCSYEERAINASMTFEEFLERSKNNHNESYDYSIAHKQYSNLSSRLTIICPKHGHFEQTASNHINGRGCPICGIERTANTLAKSTQEFIRESREIHGDKYDYSKTKYINANTNVMIICPIDGEFEQTPWSHTSGTGCPKCSRRNQGAPRNLTRALRGEFDEKKNAYVYIVNFILPDIDTTLYKVGSGTGTRVNTTQNSIRRIGGTVVSVKQYPFKSTGEAIVFEHIIMEELFDYKFVIPTDLKFPGYSEIFTQEPNLVNIENHPILIKFRAGDRWDPKK